MVRHSSKVSRRLAASTSRNHAARARQIRDDMRTVSDACPNVSKLNLVIHYKMNVLGIDDGEEEDNNSAGGSAGSTRRQLLRTVWDSLGQEAMPNLNELDLVRI